MIEVLGLAHQDEKSLENLFAALATSFELNAEEVEGFSDESKEAIWDCIKRIEKVIEYKE